MTFLELFTLLASAVTIFGLIVGVFSVYNGRMTRREITALIRETQAQTQQLIRETQTETQRSIRETHAETLTLIREIRDLIARDQAAVREILLRITEILARIDERVR